ncbi:PrgI family protein [Candidatus Agathobaculum pullicola]|uniref:PrgI family protein n=1 Tax=Candidatus Agathobaculum pullicola TaxID=2838426 RepID=UPI003F918CC4
MECPVNKEIRNYREGVFMGLSMRQTAWGAAALTVAAAANFGLRLVVGKETASVLCILLAALPAAVGFLSYHGLSFEQLACAWLRTTIRHNGWYVYRAVCLYETLHRAAIEERRRDKKKKKVSVNPRKEKRNNVQKKAG